MFVVENCQLLNANLLRQSARPIARDTGYCSNTLTDKQVAERREKIAEMRHVKFNEEVQMRILEPTNENGSTNDHSNDPKNCQSDRFHLLSFARVFSGCLQPGQKLYAIPCTSTSLHLKDPSMTSAQNNTVDVELGQIYAMMGREFVPVDRAPLGNVVALSNLGQKLTGRATLLTSDPTCPPFNDLHFYAEPILKVTVQSKNTADLPEMVEALKLLSKADPMARVYAEDTGEHVLATAGEVHLRRCVEDLTKRYSQLELDFSEPIVPFAETIVGKQKTDEQSTQTNLTFACKDPQSIASFEMFTSNKQILVKVRATPLPENISRLIESHEHILGQMESLQRNNAKFSGRQFEEFKVQFKRFYSTLHLALDEAYKRDRGLCDRIWSFGPRKARCNILFNKNLDYARPSFWSISSAKFGIEMDSTTTNQNSDSLRECDQSFINGFKSACRSGPLCEEIMYGVGFFVEDWRSIDDNNFVCSKNEVVKNYSNLEPTQEMSKNYSKTGSAAISANVKKCPLNNTAEHAADYGNTKHSENCSPVAENKSYTNTEEFENYSNAEELESYSNPEELESYSNHRPMKSDLYGPLSGQLMTAVKEACKGAFQRQPQRLMAAMYACTIRASGEVLGRVYAVLNKRNGRVIGEEMNEGTNLFEISAVLPVVESFGFCDEIRKRTSALAFPQLVFSHWEVLDVDPFWVPTTQEELEHYGVKADSANRALKYMNMVRKRKGLAVEEKTVESAEKQRTLMKK